MSSDLARKGYLGKTIGIKLRYEDFRTVTRDVTLEQPTADAHAIRAAARLCLKRVALDRPIRLLGIRIASLARPVPLENSASEAGGTIGGTAAQGCLPLVDSR